MMLSPRLTTCTDCTTIDALLRNIDCKMFQLSKKLYNNIAFLLNKPIDGESAIDLMVYKRILMYKYYNADYVEKFTIKMLASKVKLLTLNCDHIYDCQCGEQTKVTTTTTTTALPPIKFNWNLIADTPTDELTRVQLELFLNDTLVVEASIIDPFTTISGNFDTVEGDVITGTINTLGNSVDLDLYSKVVKLDPEVLIQQSSCSNCGTENLNLNINPITVPSTNVEYDFGGGAISSIK